MCNASEFFSRDTKSERIAISNPRLNICINGHPIPFIEALSTQKENYDDGLYHRFFISCPKIIIRDSADIMSASEPCVDLVMILFYVFRKNINGNSMVLEDDAKVEFNRIFDLSKKLLGKKIYFL